MPTLPIADKATLDAIAEKVGSDGVKTLFARLTELENRLDAMRPGSKLYGNASFAASVMSGCVKVANGSNYKIALDDATSRLINGGGSDTGFISNPSGQKLQYLGARTITSVVYKIVRKNNGVGNIVAEIREADSAGLPSATRVGNQVTVDGSTLTNNAINDVTFNGFNANTDINKRYCIIVTYPSTTDFYAALATASSDDFRCANYSGSAWANFTDARGHTVTINFSDKALEGWAYTQLTDSALYAFNQFFAVSDAKQGTLVLSLKDAIGNNLKTNLADKTTLQDVANAEANGTFRLHASLSRVNATDTTPEVRWWGISYMGATM